MLDVVWDVVKMLVGVGVTGLLGSLAVNALKQSKLVQRMQLEEFVDHAATRVVSYVEDLARESGATGKEQRVQAVKTLVEETNLSELEAEERIRAAYQRLKIQK